MQHDIVVHCPKCQTYQHFNYVADYVSGGDPSDGPPSRYSFGYCADCRSPFVVVQDDYGQGFDLEKAATVYPADERRLTFSVPDAVRAAYVEAVGCEAAKAWTATAVMVGRTLECLCKLEVPEAHGMFDGLKHLRDAGTISRELWEWADHLRFLRNVAAHEVNERISRDDAVDALNFVQAILEVLYHLRPKFQQMRQRRAGP